MKWHKHDHFTGGQIVLDVRFNITEAARLRAELNARKPEENSMEGTVLKMLNSLVLDDGNRVQGEDG